MNNVAIALASLADQNAVTVRYAATMLNTLRSLFIQPEQIDETVIREAQQIMRQRSEDSELRVHRLNKLREPSRTVVEVKDPEPILEAVSKPRGNICRVQIFGKYPVTAVLRWMGKNGWNLEDAACALAGLGAARLSDSTIRQQLRAGKKGERGEPAELSKHEAKKLKEMIA